MEESQVIVLSAFDVRRYSNKIEQKDVERITGILQGKLMNVSNEEIAIRGTSRQILWLITPTRTTLQPEACGELKHWFLRIT